MESAFSSIRCVPFLAAMPLLILWFGFREYARVGIVTLSAFAFVVPGLVGALAAMPVERRLLRDRIDGGAPTYFLQVCVPATLPAFVPALRVGWAIALTVAVAVDYMGSIVGVGRLVESARVTFNVPLIFLLILIVSFAGIVIDRVILAVCRGLTPWEGRTVKA